MEHWEDICITIVAWEMQHEQRLESHRIGHDRTILSTNNENINMIVNS